MNKYTPGPWFTDDKQDTDERRYVMSEKAPFPGTVAIVTLDVAEAEANARLIAAAPELLESAMNLKDVCNRPSAARTRAEAWRALDKAIAKATGEST